MLTTQSLKVPTLGDCSFPSPLNLSTIPNDEIADYVPDEARVLLNAETMAGVEVDSLLAFEKAGPRERLYFEPSGVKAAIVTCGGLCPGLNSVIRAITLQLKLQYGIKQVIGYRYGYKGLNPEHGFEPMELTHDSVKTIHKLGGSVLGVSRGAEQPSTMVDTLERDGVQILFTVGGDGTQRGAKAIYDEITRRGLNISVVGVPKTIDNDVAYVDKTFGFDTAVEIARMALNGAHTEAVSAHNGIGIVKIMGRDSGFIAAAASLASLEVNYCLVPEVHFDMEGPNGLLAALEFRLKQRGHALIAVAEGCAKSFATGPLARDASGNVQYGGADLDVGLLLKEEIGKHFKQVGTPVTIKYIDPSYMIRSVPANANDNIFCDSLARHAAHAAMAGKTGIVLGRWHNIFTHVPLDLATSHRKQIDPDGGLWLAVTENTGQPDMSNMPVSRRAAAWHAEQNK